MGQTPSIPVESARLIFSNNSVRNNTLDCDVLGLHYQLSTPLGGIKLNRTTTFSRWDPKTNENYVIAKYQTKSFGKDRIKLLPRFGGDMVGMEAMRIMAPTEDADSEDGFVPLNQFLERSKGFAGYVHVNREFRVNGKEYAWKARGGSVKLYCKQDSELPIASFSERSYFSNPHMPYIKLAPGCEQILDYIVVSFIISEKKRREAAKSQNASQAAASSSSGAC